MGRSRSRRWISRRVCIERRPQAEKERGCAKLNYWRRSPRGKSFNEVKLRVTSTDESEIQRCQDDQDLYRDSLAPPVGG